MQNGMREWIRNKAANLDMAQAEEMACHQLDDVAAFDHQIFLGLLAAERSGRILHWQILVSN